MLSLRRVLFLLLLLTFFTACGGDEDSTVRKIIYWEKWTGFEGEAIAQVVEDFNSLEKVKTNADPSYIPIEVELVTVSMIDQKLLVAIAGGNPPDVAGIFAQFIAPYADKGAATDLTEYFQKAGIPDDHYLPVFKSLGEHRGRIWAVATTPYTTAVHYNKRLFREAGLNPDRFPETIEEFDNYVEKLTIWEVTEKDGSTRRVRGFAANVPDDRKRLVQAGFLHFEPGWWQWAWGIYFGADMWNGSDTIQADSEANIQALKWIESYSHKFGVKNMQKFRSGFGNNFSSPQNPFLSGKVAMEIQGVWMYNFIDTYAPGMDWGAAPMPYPAGRPELKNTAVAEADMVIIPKDSKHPDEAFEFIRYLISIKGMETLCMGHKKFSPLTRVSENFYRDHPHPYLGLFRKMAESKNTFRTPKTGVWSEYVREMISAVDKVQNLTSTPEETLQEVQTRIQRSLDREIKMQARRSAND